MRCPRSCPGDRWASGRRLPRPGGRLASARSRRCHLVANCRAGASRAGRVARSGRAWLRMEGNGAGSLTATVAPPTSANVIRWFRTFGPITLSDLRRYPTRRRDGPEHRVRDAP
ncbi:hypothetical protein MILUP08_45236 [Micromonospora lupini str. Lupac 08]|uniref:Uncharacterized protein n=1 Tax=Micromonospora lupini str. Lupac 08 TaxID=1150864 RepID=I0L957_9ACTN|nr:hypothetical protein MILUP08_45236 [Micromonospora lupini str. Lupac 08]